MRRNYPIIIFAGVLFCCMAGCRQTHSNTSDGLNHTPVETIRHEWKELGDELCSRHGIEPKDITCWKRYFEGKFVLDDWEVEHMEYFANTDRYLAIKDLQAITYDKKNDSIPKLRCTLWRMMQYCAKIGLQIPESKDGLACLMRTQVDSVLSYVALSNADAGNKNGLSEYLHGWIYDLLSWQIQTEEDSELAKLLGLEDIAWSEYHENAKNAYQTISDSSGSGFHYQLFEFAIKNLNLRRIGVEALYAAVFPDTMIPFDTESYILAIVSEEQVKKGYRYFKNDLPDWGEGPFSTPDEMRVALDSERRSWDLWIKARARISDKLSCERKSVWDRATNEIRKNKLVMLESRYKDEWE